MVDEFRTRASSVIQKLEVDHFARRRSYRPVATARPLVDFQLGPTILVQIKASLPEERVQLAVDARWLSGTPGRNIDLRAISRDPDAIHSSRTDSSGHAEFQLDRQRYKIELEHDVHGAGGLIIDFSKVKSQAARSIG